MGYRIRWMLIMLPAIVPQLFAVPSAPAVSASDGTYADKVHVSVSTITAKDAVYRVYRNTKDACRGAEDGCLMIHEGGSTYDDTSVSVDTVYYYWGQRCSDFMGGCSSLSASDTGYAHLPIPKSTEVTASDGTYTDMIELSITPSDYATSYTIYRSIKNSLPTSSYATTSSASYNDKVTGGTTAGTTYYYWVKACNAGGCSAASPSDSGYALAAPSSTSVSASDGTYTDKVVLNITPSSGATSYRIYRSQTGTIPASSMASTASTTFNDTGVTAGITYYYWVKACNSAGCSAASVYNTGYAEEAVTIPPKTTIDASDGNYTDKVALSIVPSSGATSYEIHRATTNSYPAKPYHTVMSTSYDDTAVTAGTTYYYWVRACNSVGCSSAGASDTGYARMEATIPAIPRGVEASDGKYSNYVEVVFDSVTDAQRYEIYVSEPSEVSGTMSIPYLIGTVSADLDRLSYRHETSRQYVKFEYFVKACNGDSCSEFSDSDSGYVKVPALEAPMGISASDGKFLDKVHLIYEKVAKAESYRIYRKELDAQHDELVATVEETEWEDTSVRRSVLYRYRVQACNGFSGCGELSSSDNGYANVPAKPDLAVTAKEHPQGFEIEAYSPFEGIDKMVVNYYLDRNRTDPAASGPDYQSDFAFVKSFDIATMKWFFDHHVYNLWSGFSAKLCNAVGCSEVSEIIPQAISIGENTIPPMHVTASEGLYNMNVVLSWYAPNMANGSFEILRRNRSDNGEWSHLLNVNALYGNLEQSLKGKVYNIHFYSENDVQYEYKIRYHKEVEETNNLSPDSHTVFSSSFSEAVAGFSTSKIASIPEIPKNIKIVCDTDEQHLNITNDISAGAEYYKRAIKKEGSNNWIETRWDDDHRYMTYFQPDLETVDCSDQFVLKVAACNMKSCSEYSMPVRYPRSGVLTPAKSLAATNVSIDGYFFHFGSGAYEWIYVTSGLGVVAKLTGMDAKGFLTWDVLHSSDARHFDKIILSDKKDKISFGGLTKRSLGSVDVLLSGRTFIIDGYFAHYGKNAYDWVYVNSSGDFAAKLSKLNPYGFFHWNTLQSGQIQSFERIDLDLDHISIAFGDAIDCMSSEEGCSSGQSSSEPPQNCRDSNVDCPVCGEDEVLTYFDDGTAFCKPMEVDVRAFVFKTGQLLSRYRFDDGYYQKGLDHNYTFDTGVMTDNVTKLQWFPYEVWGIGDNAAEYCERSIVGGYTDWRLPTIAELRTLMDLAGRDTSAINYRLDEDIISSDSYQGYECAFETYWNNAYCSSHVVNLVNLVVKCVR